MTAATSAATRRARADLHVGDKSHEYGQTIFGITWGRHVVHHRGAVNVKARVHHPTTVCAVYLRMRSRGDRGVRDLLMMTSHGRSRWEISISA